MTRPRDLVIPDAPKSQVAAVVTVERHLRLKNNADAAGGLGRQRPGPAGEFSRVLRGSGYLIHGDHSYSKES
jgi:hypothetical protein